jgi:hypothetical protein
VATDPQPAESQDSILAALSNLLGGAQQAQPDISSLFNEALSANANATPPATIPVPGGTNPYGRMASIFAASLADQLGARGSLVGTQAKLAQNDEASIAAAHENFARKQAFDDKKAMERMGILMKIGEAKSKALEKQGDMAAYEAQVKANLMMADRARKLQEDVDARAAEAAHKNRLEEIIAAKKSTPEEKKIAADAKAQDMEDKAVLRFQEDISNVAKKPGATSKQMVPGSQGIFNWGGDKAIALTPSAVQQIRGRSAATARSAGSQRLRETALQTYIDTMRNSTTGEVDRSTPEYKRFWTLVTSVIPDQAARTAFLTSVGF